LRANLTRDADRIVPRFLAILGLMPGAERQCGNTEIGPGEELQGSQRQDSAVGYPGTLLTRRVLVQDRDAVDTLPSQRESDCQAVLPITGNQHIMYGIPILVADRSDPRAVGIIEQRQFTACTAMKPSARPVQ
jgi:hypothetical protein